MSAKQQYCNTVTVYILIANKYRREYDARNKEIELKVDVELMSNIKSVRSTSSARA